MQVQARRNTVRLAIAAVLVVVAALVPAAGDPAPAFAGPIADSQATYDLCGRVFPDPQAYWLPTVGEDTPHPGTGVSPWAKGNAPCAARTFMTYDEAIRGLTFLADELEGTSDLVEVIDLSTTDDPRITEVLDQELGDGWSEGIPNELGERERVPLHLVKVTAPEGAQLVDDVAPVAEEDRDHFVWALSMHGIERAGVEGGVRAIEDLATWGATDPDRRLLETYDEGTITTQSGREAENLRVGEVLMRSVSYFVLSNPDGWRRGDPDQGNAGFMRFNGNGMDLNRDWPELGYTDPSYTPWSETESRSVGRVLQNLSDNWTGGIDLHGMVAANAYSYTLVGGSQRPYGKNERTMQFVQEAWADAEARLLWSPQVKPNDAPEQCVVFTGVAPNGETNAPPDCDQRVYGVQYGTIWDTIEYTVTGAMGNWIDSPVGLNADGIDNEMMLSHLGNCGTGTCYVADAEQLHVDGNKSLVYAMLNFSLQPPEATFDTGGDIGWLVNPRRLVDPGVERPTAPTGAIDAEDLAGEAFHPGGSATTVLAEFTVDNAAGETFVAGISGSARFSNLASESLGGDLGGVRVQYRDPESDTWTSRPVYGAGVGYRTPGAHSDWNYPQDGDYRFVVTGPTPTQVWWELERSVDPVWDQPLQEPFDVSNLDFFTELEPFLGAGTTLTPVDVDEVLAGTRDLADFDTVIAVDDALLPGHHPEAEVARGVADLPATGYGAADAERIGALLRGFAEDGGNVVLTDDALRGVAWMGLLDAGAVRRGTVYAGHVSFNTDAGYDDPLAAGLDEPGAAAGVNQRRQMVEPVPIGYALNNSQPQWYLDAAAVEAAGGRVVGHDSGNAGRAALAELPVGAGTVRAIGSLLPYPTTANYHPLGLGSYAVTDNGYTVLRNLLTWDNAAQNPAPDLTGEVEWVASDTPTRVYVDGSNDLPCDDCGSGSGQEAASAEQRWSGLLVL